MLIVYHHHSLYLQLTIHFKVKYRHNLYIIICCWFFTVKQWYFYTAHLKKKYYFQQYYFCCLSSYVIQNSQYKYWHLRNKIIKAIQCNKTKSHISRHCKNSTSSSDFFCYSNIEKSALHLIKKWKFAKMTVYLKLQNINELQNIFLKK